MRLSRQSGPYITVYLWWEGGEGLFVGEHIVVLLLLTDGNIISGNFLIDHFQGSLPYLE